MSRKDDRFTGGDSLEAGTLKHAVHLAMMTNELSGGHGAYRIGNAVLAESGPSFGAFQYDLGSSPHGRQLFEKVAFSAIDERGGRILQGRDLQDIRDHLYKSFKKIDGSDVSSDVFERLRPLMDKALSSDAGRQMINQDYLEGLDKKIESLNATITAIPDADNRSFLQNNRLAQLIVIDTANQYGPPVNRGLHTFMGMDVESEPMNMPGRARKEQIGIDGQLGIEDLVRYKLETQYGQTNGGARDVLRRISNLIDAVGPDKIDLTPEDRRFFATGLREYLKENGRDPAILNHPALRTLRSVSARSAESVPSSNKHAVDSLDARETRDTSMIERLRTGIDGLDQASGKRWDDHSERLLASAYGLAKQSGFTGRDDLQVALSQPTAGSAGGNTFFVYCQGPTASPDPAANRAHMTMHDALAFPAGERYAQISAFEQSQVQATALTATQEDAVRRGPLLA